MEGVAASSVGPDGWCPAHRQRSGWICRLEQRRIRDTIRRAPQDAQSAAARNRAVLLDAPRLGGLLPALSDSGLRESRLGNAPRSGRYARADEMARSEA